MKTCHRRSLAGLLLLSSFLWARAQQPPPSTPAELLSATLNRVADLIEPREGTPAPTLTATLEIVKAQGVSDTLAGQKIRLALRAPDRLAVTVQIDGQNYSAGRNGQRLWVYAPGKQFGVVGKPGLPRFASAPDKKDTRQLEDFKLPISRDQLALATLILNVKGEPAQTVDGVRCHVLEITPRPEASALLKQIASSRLGLWIRESDRLPAKLTYTDGKKMDVALVLRDLGDSCPEQTWQIPSRPGDTVETTALSHLARFFPVVFATLTQRIPPLGPATGAHEVVATEGQGRLEMIDGTRVLFLKGTPEEMGRQHGVLLKRPIRDVTRRILYGVGVGSSFAKGRWFFGEIEQAQRRISPFIHERYLREMNAIAAAAERDPEEIQLANFFPELFHCSGFALYGDATAGGRLYHGRILDYLKGVGLEQNAVVMVCQPDQGHAWVNISYAGFVGSVTGMNEKQIAIGEMGGRGEGNWDGKPMAQLVREVLEQADTLDEAVEIMRQGPRTCEYYYVISDGKSKRAVGIAATPTTFETVWAGQTHPRLPHPIKDAVLMSAGDRYEKLVERVKAGYGKIDADAARDLMRRPVAMKSNIHSALFAPETLDFWVANADSDNPAAHARYTHYNLKQLLGR